MATASAVNFRVSPTAGALSTRLVSLDVFRGLTMAAMVVVNNPGDDSHVYWPLEHAAWNGWTPTDLIFPFFLFIVGVAITLSRRSAAWGTILRRGALIVAIGWALALYPRFDFAHWRLPGVLPRIGVCYIAAAAVFKMTRGSVTARWRQPLVLTIIAVGLCAAYWFWMMRVPTPAGVAGDLSPEGNWGAYIDRAVFGTPHLWSLSKTWDPEGLLSTIPALATTLLGIVAGLWLGADATREQKTAGLLAGAIVGIAVGRAWDPYFPINKNLWTSSYVFFTAGAACLLLAVCYWTIDVRGWRGWTRPFVILGTNAITLFAASALLVKTLLFIEVAKVDDEPLSLWGYLYARGFEPFFDPYIASLAFALANLAVLFALLAWMHRRHLFLRV